MAATTTPPLAVPLRYDPIYKVDIRLHEPLLSHRIDQLEVKVGLFALCEQFEVICRHEAQNSKSHAQSRVSNVFHNKATVIIDHMKQAVTKLPHSQVSLELHKRPPSIVGTYFSPSGHDLTRLDQAHRVLGLPRFSQQDEYLFSIGLDSQYPRVIAYLGGGNQFSLSSSPGNMEGYFSRLAALNQVVCLSTQINEDLRSKHNHNYVAHQLALLYQSLNSLGESSSLAPFKKSIEDNFKPLKSAMIVDKDLNKPVLMEDMRTWLLEVTANLTSIILAFPTEVATVMTQPALMLSRI